jgi:hypothetical protein
MSRSHVGWGVLEMPNQNICKWKSNVKGD